MDITGVRDLARLEGAVMALSMRIENNGNAKAARAMQVNGLIAKGKLMPKQKAWAMKASAAALEQYLESLGDAKVGPVGEEFEPDDKADEVAEARAKASVPDFNPDAIVLSADEQKLIKNMAGGDKTLAERLLADKRDRARAQHAAKHGIRA
jgi:hypothetical protein